MFGNETYQTALIFPLGLLDNAELWVESGAAGCHRTSSTVCYAGKQATANRDLYIYLT